jgi:hypothetical protein
VLDLRFARQGGDHRWSEWGEPTLYVAGDEAVVLGELARHFRTDRGASLARGALDRDLFSFRAKLEAVLDLRDEAVWEELALVDAPHCFLSKPVARATARFLRTSTPAQGLLVPSAAFLDQLHRWLAVLFLEKLPPDASGILTDARFESRFRVEA